MHSDGLSDRLGAYLLPDSDQDLRERFYERLCLAGAILTLAIVIPTNIFQDLPIVVSAMAGLFGLVAFALYLLARRGHYYPGSLLVAQLVMLSVGWFPNAGTQGSLPYYFFIPICYVVMFYRGRRVWVLSALVIAVATVLTLLEYARPDLPTPFPSDRARLVDLITGLVVSGFTCAFILWMATTSYDRERRRLNLALASLTATEERFAEIFRVYPEAVYLFDGANRVFVDVNEGFTRLTGWSREEAVGRSGVDLGLWVDEGERLRFVDLVATRRRVDRFLSRLRARDGRLFWGSTSLAVVTYDGADLLLMTTRDVTTEVEARRAIEESRARLSTLIDSTDDMVWLVEPVEFRLVLFNAALAQAARANFGLQLANGMRPSEIMPAPHDLEWRGFYERTLREGSFSTEYAVPGTDTTVLHSFNPVRVDGRVTGIAVFGKDITEHKRNEAERERLEMQLLEAQKMESLGSLAGGVAHDFNNMLGGILGYADLLLQDEHDAGRRHDLEAIVQAATRSAELTRKLLAFGRRGKNIVEPVDLDAIVADCVTMLRPTFRPDVTLDLSLGTGWTIDADPGQINQLVVNLAINACEAMPHGGTLHLQTTEVTLDEAHAQPLPAGDYVQLIVADTGVGMTEEVRMRIFEPFFTTKVRGSTPGTGLGLSTVYGIVHLHRGSIVVQSTPGMGSRFVVRLPRGVLGPVAARRAPGTGPGEGLVLVVEDEPILRRFATTALARLGYQSLTAEDGVQAVEAFRRHHEGLKGVLLDLKMPKMDGREAFLAFRAIDPGVPVVVCSGYGDNEEAQGLISLGALGLLPKPYRIADLAEMLGRFTRH
ncbi:MAG: PAS domain S-box protein [Vicinamibacterales bacterium]